MRNPRTTLGPAIAVALAAAAGLTAHRDARAVCETPLVARQVVASANVLILFDSSGSMNEAVYHDAYDPGITYTGDFDPTRTYDVASDGNRTPRNFNSGWPNTPSAYLVNSDAGEDGSYSGNYLNWVYFHATATQRGAIPRLTRVQVAKQAVNTVVTTGTNVRYGVIAFDGDDGGTIVSPIGTDVATIQAQVNAIRASSYTPLAETMVDALDYFASTGASAPITDACQKSFVVIISDGHPTRDLDVPAYLRDVDGDGREPGNCASVGSPYPNSYDCSEYLDDVAMYMQENDLRPDLDGEQNVTTFVIGFNIDAPILAATATRGGGSYASADNAAQLAAALADALGAIETRVSASSSVSVVSAEDRTSNRLFRARFETVTWRGFVEAFALPYASGDAPLWEAGALLGARDPDSRAIYTSTTGANTVEFTTARAADLQGLLGAATTADATSLIQYTRGSAVTGTRDRNGWRLGDIVDSSPTVVGKPAAFHDYLNYPSYHSANRNRDEMLYVGANDGMLHAFKVADGSEAWAYVPKAVLPRLSALAGPGYCHEYFVNMTPVAYDIHIGGSWKTVLIGGQERGGSSLFALDVTDPRPGHVSVLWDVDLPELKGSWTRPALVHDERRNAFVLCVGTGLDTLTGQASLLVLDPADGAVLTTLALGSAAGVNLTTAATAIDRDFDGFDDLLYLGDLAGNLWRVDVTANPWSVTRLFAGTQPIQSAPVLSMDEQGRVLVFFGTGRYLTPADLGTTGTQSFYGVTDNHSGTTVTRSDLADQTSSFTPATAAHRGWFFDLVRASGERIIRTPALIAGVLHVPSFRPHTDSCAGGGESWLYSVDFADGSLPDDASGAERNTTAGRVQSMGDGVLSNPSVDLVNEDIILQSSNATMITQSIGVALQRLVVRSWRQVWNRE
jgi:type IV pilus assembly protein PilY1